jgi:hypothetical protein
LCLAVPVVLPAQAPVRTRDLSMASVRYENGLTLGAMTLFESLALYREHSSTAAWGLLSLFHDGNWSMQGGLEGSRRSQPVPVSRRFGSLFRSMRSELALDAGSTAQAGFMPTLQLTGHGRFLFEHDRHGVSTGGAVARSFDGRLWRTAVIGEAGAWLRRGATQWSISATPMQLAVGDVLADAEAALQWGRGETFFGASLGIRVGESQRGTIGWGGITIAFPARPDLWTTLSVGAYPANLIQGLPGGRYVAFTLRLPDGRLPPLRWRPPPPPPPPPPPELPVSERLALVVGFALDSADLREIRVWAPGIDRVELMADFVDWVPVPLIKQPNGEWRGYYEVPPGLHRLNLRLDGKDIDVPTNHSAVDDEFVGRVALVMVR